MPRQSDKYFVTAAIKLALIEDDNVNEGNIKTQNFLIIGCFKWKNTTKHS